MAVLGDTLRALLITPSLATGAAQDADALPTGLLRRNGTALATAVTVTDIGLGRYLFVTSLLSADNWVQGDHYALEATWEMEGTADLAQVVEQGTIRPSEIVAAAQVAATTLTIRRGDTVNLALPLLGDITGYTEVWLTIKANPADTDENAIIQVQETLGLVRLNKAETTAGWASLTVVDDATGELTLGMEPDATSLLRAASRLQWDAQVLLPTGVFTRQSGVFRVLEDITHAIA